jgi:3-deoxy-D-manno-octulosonic-acid transferase/heptosyltransferase-1
LTSTPAGLSTRDFRKILLIKLSAVGDVVHTFPVLNKLRRRYPAAQIDWLVSSPIAEFLSPHPAINDILEFAREEWTRPWRLTPLANSARLATRLRAAGYDLVLDLQGQLRSGLCARATRAPVRIGFGKPLARRWEEMSRKLPDEARKHAWQGAREGSWLAYTHYIPLPSLEVHAVDRYLAVGPMLGLDDGAADFSFPIPRAAADRIDALLHDHGIANAKLVALAPGTVWETKQWRREGFAAVARNFLQKGLAVTLVGSARERALGDEVAALAPGTINLAGETTLPELAALIRRSAIAVTNDSGPMHLAVALGRPVVSIFGPTYPVWAGPYRRADVVLQADIPCSPCYLRQLSRCRYAHDCMREVTAEAVVERAESVLRNAGAGVRVA